MISLSLDEIHTIERRFGNPFYIFDEAAFEKNYLKLQSTMQNYYSNYQLAYSLKTNYTPYVCSLVNRFKGFAEVVSDMEYEIARKAGFEDRSIIYNGPDKGDSGIQAVIRGCLVNADSLEEVVAICNMAKENKDQQFRFGLRVNLAIGQSFVSRFGMDERDIEKAFELVSGFTNLRIIGLHCHISRCRGIEAWKKRTITMLSLCDRFFADIVPEYIDLGSGMFGEMDPMLAVQFEGVPSYEEYAQVTAGLIADHYKDKPSQPVLYTEPGTTLINKYIDFIGRVDTIKTVRGKTIAILNCSEHNLGETCTLKKLPIRVISDKARQDYYEDVDFTGYTCLEQDVLYTAYSGPLGRRDYVQFGNCGGYSNVYKPPFIRPNCAMVVKKSDGAYETMKYPETVEDIIGTYCFA